MIFSNWLLMYLSTEEVRNLFRRMLSWLEEDGFSFFRESCFKKSGTSSADKGKLFVGLHLTFNKIIYCTRAQNMVHFRVSGRVSFVNYESKGQINLWTRKSVHLGRSFPGTWHFWLYDRKLTQTLVWIIPEGSHHLMVMKSGVSLHPMQTTNFGLVPILHLGVVQI